MKLSTKGRYAMVALADLALQPGDTVVVLDGSGSIEAVAADVERVVDDLVIGIGGAAEEAALVPAAAQTAGEVVDVVAGDERDPELLGDRPVPLVHHPLRVDPVVHQLDEVVVAEDLPVGLVRRDRPVALLPDTDQPVGQRGHAEQHPRQDRGAERRPDPVAPRRVVSEEAVSRTLFGDDHSGDDA